jgi:pSer/pThr/pTyr-binding forkhead associated (FHA) protein
LGRAYLEIDGDQGAEAVELDGDSTHLVGRDSANAIAFPSDPAVSRRHAVLEQFDGGWLVRDIGSSNGTFVNGAEIDAEQVLAPGDAIEVGHQRMVFRLVVEMPTEEHVVAEAAPPEAAPAAPDLDLREEWSGAAAMPAPTNAGAGPEPVTPAPEPSAPTPAAPAPPPASPAPAPPRRGAAQVRGTARSINLREGGDKPSVLNFRVDRFDASGNRIEPVAVELNYYRSGQVSDGDEVEVTGTWSDGAVKASKIVNLSTGASVKGLSPAVKRLLIIAFAAICLFILLIFLSIIAGFVFTSG